MKFYLQSGIFAPLTIVLSIAPALIIFMVLVIPWSGDESVGFFIGLGVIALVYVLLIFLIYKLSKSKKYYLIVQEDEVIINYPNLSQEGKEKRIAKSEIVEFVYIRLYSIRGWLFTFLDLTSLALCSVTVIYTENGEEKSHVIGHLKAKEIKKLCEDNNFVLKMR